MKTGIWRVGCADAYNEFWWDIPEGFSAKGGKVRDGVHDGLGGLGGQPERGTGERVIGKRVRE